MIERLHRTIEELGHLPPEVQEAAAEQLEALISAQRNERHDRAEQRSALDLLGAWSDIPWERMDTELDRIRHENEPTPPIDEP